MFPKKNVTWAMVTIFIFLLVFIGCDTAKTTVVVTNEALKTYINTYTKKVSDEVVKQFIINNKKVLAAKALNNYFNESELKGLDQTDKIKQSVLLAIAQLKKE